MPAPRFSLTLTGSASAPIAVKEQLEQSINSGFEQLHDQTAVVSSDVAPLQSGLSSLESRFSAFEGAGTDTIRGYTTLAQLEAEVQPARTIGRVYDDPDPENNGDYISNGASWVFVGADRIGKVEAATGAPLASFRLPLIHDPWGVKSGGNHTLYVPRHGYVRRGSNILNGAYGADSTMFPGYVGLTVTNTGAATVYVDLLDETNPYKITNWPDLPPAERPDTIVIVAEIYQLRIKTSHAIVKLEDADKEFISFRWPIVVDGDVVRFGAFYHYSPQTLFTFYQPTAPVAYWELPMNSQQSSQWRYYFDRAAALNGETPIKVADSGVTRPLAMESKAGLIEIGTAINRNFQTVHPAIGAVPGAGVPNMLPLGNDPDRAPRYDPVLTTAENITDASLIAMEMTRGFGGLRPMPRIKLPAETPSKGWIFIRVCVQVAADNDFANPSIYLQAADGRNLAVLTPLMEKMLSARAAVYTRIVDYDLDEAPAMLTVGYVSSGRITAGHQYYIGATRGAIASGDFAGAGIDDILFPPTMFTVTGRELPIWRDGIVPDRTSEGRVAIYSSAPVAGTDAPYVQQIVDHAVVGGLANFTLGIAGIRGRPSFRATRSVSVIRRELPLSGAVSVLAIGDSNTNRELPARIRTKLIAFGLTPTMLGTMANEGGQPGEGRGSWEFADFVGMDSEFPAVPIGGEAAYLAKSSANADPSGRWGANPFLRPATGSDPAGNVFGGLVFDFPAYLSRFSVPVPGFVTLNLGTNDINLRTPTAALDQITTALAIMVPSILAASPTIRVGVGIPTLPRSELGDGKWTSHMVAAISAILAECDKHTRADAVPVWAQMSPDFGWPVSARQTRAGRVAGAVGDELHPIELGRSLFAEANAQWIACRS